MMHAATRFVRWRHQLDVWRFARQRAEYLEYLHAVLQGSAGQLTVRELFDRDALRHGAATVRGRLSRVWAQACEAAGGDLYATWLGCFPADELALIRTAQTSGNVRLLACLQALARHLGLLIEAQRILWATLGAAAVAALIASVLLLAVPAWTVPALQQAFGSLPPAYQGGWTRALFGTAGWLRHWGLLLPPAAAVFAAAVVYSLPRACGPWRSRLDRHGPWRLYRQVQAMRLLALIGILLEPGAGGGSARLRPVVALFLADARPWLARHLRGILWHVDQGLAGAAAFDTGLLDSPQYWYLQDMAAAHGLPRAIHMTQARMASLWLSHLRLQAQVLRWGALLSGVCVVLGVGLWHYAAIDELRRGWMMFHAGQ